MSTAYPIAESMNSAGAAVRDRYGGISEDALGTRVDGFASSGAAAVMAATLLC